MAALPDYVRVVFAGQSEEFDPSVERTEMERGVPKQRIINTSVLMKLSMSFYFASAADAMAFDDWYFDDIKRIGWFTMLHPFTGASITCRFDSGSIGKLVPDEMWVGDFRRDVTVEYLR